MRRSNLGKPSGGTRRLEFSGRQFRALIENALDLIAVLDREGVMLYVSPSVGRVLGYHPKNLIGRNLFAFVHPDDHSATLASFRESVAQAGPCRWRAYRFRHQDGSWRFLESDARSWLDQPELQSVVLNSRDVTERRQQEEALLQERQFSERLIESSVDGILAFDRGFSYTLWNPGMRRLTGLGKDEVLGRSAFEVIPFWADSGEDVFYRRALSGENVAAKDRCYRDGGDREVFFEAHYSPLRSQTGEIIGGLGVLRDITEKKHFEQQMQHAQKLETLGVLAGGIAHDFNNLLMVILGNAELAALQLPAAAPARESVGQIETAATRAADLCKQMLAYSGKGKFIVKPVDLSGLVKQMADLLEIAVAKKGTLLYELADDLPAVEADTAQLQQVVMNLITNAADALQPGNGEVVVKTRAMVADAELLSRCYHDGQAPDGLYVCLEVSDNGCGMDEQTQARIFDPFFTTKFTGRGLGMAAVLGIIRGHRGAIRLVTSPGQGTTIQALFPPSLKAPHAFTKEAPALDSWRGTGTVLVVDDEEMVRQVAKAILESVGFAVRTAENGAEAVDVFRQSAGGIDLVLMDMTMPQMNGEEAFARLREIAPNVRVVMASGYSAHDATTHATAKHLAGFIQKPYRAAELVAKLRGLLER